MSALPPPETTPVASSPAGTALPRSRIPQPINNHSIVRISAGLSSPPPPTDSDQTIISAAAEAVSSPSSVPWSPPSSTRSLSDAARSSSSPPAIQLRHFRYILIHFRPLEKDEMKELSRHFSNIMALDPRVHEYSNDLSQLPFDCLLIDYESKKSKKWYDEVRLQALMDDSIKVIVIRRSSSCMSNLEGLIEHISPDCVMKNLPTLVDNTQVFLRKLLATKGPNLKSATAAVASKLISAASK